MQGNWLPTKDTESGRPMRELTMSVLKCTFCYLLCISCVASRPELFFNAHCGSVCCAERSPFFRDIILTVGGWNFCIWKQGNTVGLHMLTYPFAVSV